MKLNLYNIDKGNILILCIDTSYIPVNKESEQRCGRFYGFGGGHFIVVKGYIKVDDTVYFETYDPNNWHRTYGDGTPKGKSRYYKDVDLLKSVTNWWNYYIQINPKDEASGGGYNYRIPLSQNIPVKWGGLQSR